MDEQTKESIALFRYGMITPLLNDLVERKAYLEQQAQKTHDIPYYGEKKIAGKTILEWLSTYRREGFDGLKPRHRGDKGNARRLSPDQQDHILASREQTPDMPVTVFYEQLIKNGEINAGEVSYATMNRLLKNQGLTEKETKGARRKRFAHGRVNVLWQGDVSHGPFIGRRQTYLYAYIDDCSRLVPYAQFFDNEKFDGLREITKEALLRRGVPKVIYADNGKIYRSETLQFACAQLGITLTHTQPYDAQAKGKIERFFRTVRTRFYPLLQANPVTSLEELNERFWHWLENDYHRSIHASLDGQTPHERFHAGIEDVRFLDDPSVLDSVFLKREQRKVRADGTITLHKTLYEVPPHLIGQSIDVRMDENHVYVYEDGQATSEIVPVTFEDNAHVKRDRSPFSFSQMSDTKEDD
ncbi:DDE-type integrase/transposase/recombinase [Alkalibacillus silvisoli]|uniref:DDE-type integrase/transposase/recombinase n=1 Tax=Alkalibacillus silvisoli TaxID=392823 RepID=A0ABN0ZYR8_9BACI